MTTDQKQVHTIDAAGKKLGRVASEAAMVLMGKNRTDYVRNKAPDVEVHIENASRLDLPQKKRDQTEYIRHSGFPGGLKSRTMQEMIDKRGYDEVVRLAVRGMLPSNRLRAGMLKRLKVKK